MLNSRARAAHARRTRCTYRSRAAPSQYQGQLKLSPAGFNWRKAGGGKEITVTKDGAPLVCRLCDVARGVDAGNHPPPPCG
jgi:hypothetical protein